MKGIAAKSMHRILKAVNTRPDLQTTKKDDLQGTVFRLRSIEY